MSLAERLRLIVITDEALAKPRSVVEVVEAALEAGTPSIQLREKSRSVAELLPLALDLAALARRHGALFFVNDRLDLALAAGAHGVHLGPDDLPVHAARRSTPAGFLIGYSTSDPDEAVSAELHGADYIGCGSIWTTTSKDDAGVAIGPEGLARVVRAVNIPVVGIGGITPAGAARLVDAGAAGTAVIGAVMGAREPSQACRALLEPFQTQRPPGPGKNPGPGGH